MNTITQFPYENFPYKLEHKDGKEKRVCYFECKDHLDKYLVRYNIKKKDADIHINKKKVK
jgi:hypothetical protein